MPAEIYALVEDTPATLLFESSQAAEHDSASLLFTAPLRVLVANESAELHTLFDEIERATSDGYFVAGFFSYECGKAFEPKAEIRPGKPGEPLAWLGVYERSYRFDHRLGAFLDGDPPGITAGRYRAASIHDTATPPVPLVPRLALAPQQYAARIEEIHERIRAGDVYQLNFTFPLHADFAGNAAALYERLHQNQPADYGAFLHWKRDRRILSFSPELFFRLEEEHGKRLIFTQPMKGTAPRGRTTEEDLQIAEWLRNDPKNRSENVMIVDLLRNDLGRLCAFGTVRVESLFAVRRYQTLWQMTSTVTGELRSNLGYEEIFRALFPCGSITGAPKVRAVQLIAGIESEPRGVYTGAIGYFSRQRSVFNVAIRTLELDGNRCTMGVGSGIVIDSNAAGEYSECQLKAEFLTRMDEPFSLVETLLWNGEYPLIELHLDRLEDSAHYFGFICDRAAAKASLLATAESFPDRAPRKVRLLAAADASLNIQHEAIPAVASASHAPMGRVRLALERTDSSDRFLFHKTTHRPLYASAWKTAHDAGFDDVLFLNERNEVTEGAISNLFIEKEGRWLTPPIECGLLPGVYRRHLLATRPLVEERVLYPRDLKTADAIYLANAVRGLRRVTIDWESA